MATFLRLRILVLACGLLASYLPAARAEPALWAVHDHGATVYLFGTVHVLKPDTDWQSPKVTGAFNEATDVWFEIDQDAPDKMQLLVASLGTDPGHPLSSKFSKADVARIGAAAKAGGISGGEAALEPMRPWFAATMLSITPVLKAGFDPNSGVDRTLRTEAEKQGKHIHGFETVAQQLHFLADLPLPAEREMLLSTLDDYEAGPALLGEMIDDWAKGDADALGAILLRDMSDKQYPALYQNLVVRRNEDWARQIAAQLQSGKPAISFVAVGAAHLAGPDSLLVQLQKQGLAAERQ